MAEEKTAPETEVPPMPPQPKTVSLPAMTDRALLEDLARTARETQKQVGQLTLNVDSLMGDHQSLHSRVGGIEGRLAKLESPSIPPPRPLTSERVRQIGDDHMSKSDLELQAKQAEEITRRALADEERDRKIAATYALAVNAATKSDVQAVVDSTATKEEVKKLVDDAAIAQTAAIVQGVKVFVSKPLVQKIGYAAGVLVLQALTLGTAYLAMKGH